MNNTDRRRGPMPESKVLRPWAALWGLTPTERAVVKLAAKRMGEIQRAQATRSLGRAGWTKETPDDLVRRVAPTWQRQVRLLCCTIDYARARGWIEGNMYNYGSAA